MVNIGLNFLLIPRYGGMGATVATLLSYVVFCALRYWASNLFFKVRYEWGRVFAILTLGTLLTAGFYVNDSLRGESQNRATLFVSLAIKATLALSFPLLLFAFGFFHERELGRLYAIWMQLTASLSRRNDWSEAKVDSLIEDEPRL
jgi:peptidoglycan biosynthesis protein MviN/MurJ (putative lipid II flippase)